MTKKLLSLTLMLMLSYISFANNSNKENKLLAGGNTYVFERIMANCGGQPPRFVQIGTRVKTYDECGNLVQVDESYNGNSCDELVFDIP